MPFDSLCKSMVPIMGGGVPTENVFNVLHALPASLRL